MKCKIKRFLSNILTNDQPILSWGGDLLDIFDEPCVVESVIKKPGTKKSVKVVTKTAVKNDKKEIELPKFAPKFAHIMRKFAALSWTGAWSIKIFNACPRAAFLRSAGLRKKIQYSSDFALRIGILIHKYVLADKFTPELNEELKREYWTEFAGNEQHLSYDISSIVLKAREKLFLSIQKKLKKGYTVRFEEEYRYKVQGIDVLQYVDCYAFKFHPKKKVVDCYIYDLKTSKNKNTDPTKYLGQLIYYATNLRKKISEEFNVEPHNINIKCFIVWAIYVPSVQMFDHRDSGRIISTPTPFSPMEQTVTPITAIAPEYLWKPIIDITIEPKGFGFRAIQNSMTPALQDESLVKITPVPLEIDKEVDMTQKIKESIEIIQSGEIPQCRDFCTLDYGCDYISICNGKNILNPKLFDIKKHTLDVIGNQVTVLD